MLSINKLPIMAGITKLIIQIPKAAAPMPSSLPVKFLSSVVLAPTLTGNSINPTVGATAITK